MTIQLRRNIQDALQKIELTLYHEFPLKNNNLNEEAIAAYGKAKWAIIDILNQHYGPILTTPFDLYHWLDRKEEDEVAYFLNEAGSNTLNHSEFKMPDKFQLWLGEKGFIIGIEQKGKWFNASEISNGKPGGGFSFFEKCKSVIFFDDCTNARTIYLLHCLPEGSKNV